jgi:hypothetical protein
MRRLVVLLASPFLVGFAPVPPIRPLDDPDQAISQFDRQVCAAVGCPRDNLTRRRRQLIGRLEDLQDRLERQGKPDEAGEVRDRAVLAGSLDSSNRLGEDKPLSLIRQASVAGKYRHLLHVIHAPADRGVYTGHKDFGFWTGHTYAGQENLKPGHWVYVYPRWFIWRDGPPKP